MLFISTDQLNFMNALLACTSKCNSPGDKIFQSKSSVDVASLCHVQVCSENVSFPYKVTLHSGHYKTLSLSSITIWYITLPVF